MSASEIMQLFVNRRDVYAIQLKVGQACIYVPRYGTLTEDDVQRHLDGKITLGVYALNVDNSVKWICFDIDSAHVERTADVCELIVKRCVEHYGEDAVRAEKSGSEGNFHVWLFFAQPVQAVYARALGLEIADGLVGVEVFPKQTVLSGKMLGNLVKLPLGLHLKSGKKSEMSIEGVKPCTINETEIKVAVKSFDEKPRFEFGYKGKDPLCIVKIKKGLKAGVRNNAGIIYASYLTNFRQFSDDRAWYLFRLWNEGNKPALEKDELRTIFDQAVSSGYVFGCGHEYLKLFCVKEGCVFGNVEKNTEGGIECLEN